MALRDFKIRPATSGDLPALLRLIRSLAEYERLLHRVVATEEQLGESLFGSHPIAEALLGLWQNQAVAYAVYFTTFSTFAAKPRLYLEDIFVEPSHRGKGFGGALLRHLCRIATARGCESLRWEVLTWNESALEFYRHCGAQVITEWVGCELAGDALQELARQHEATPDGQAELGD